MRTTLDIDAHLLKRLRTEAERRGVPFKEVIVGAIRRGLDERPAGTRTPRYRMPTVSMGHPRPGINLDKALTHAVVFERKGSGGS